MSGGAAAPAPGLPRWCCCDTAGTPRPLSRCGELERQVDLAVDFALFLGCTEAGKMATRAEEAMDRLDEMRAEQARLASTSAGAEAVEIAEPECEKIYMETLEAMGRLIANALDTTDDAEGFQWRPAIDGLFLEPGSLWGCSQLRAARKTLPTLAHDLVLVIDVSGSMTDLLTEAKFCLKDIVDTCGTRDRLCLVAFHSHAEVKCDWVDVATPSQQHKILDAIDNLSAGGGTCFIPALTAANEQLTKLRDIWDKDARAAVFARAARIAAAEETKKVVKVTPTIQLMPCHGGKLVPHSRTRRRIRQRAPRAEAAEAAQFEEEEGIERAAAVVFLSDGIPHEYPETIRRCARQVLGDTCIVSLGVSHGCQVETMALVAQAGCGPSFFIRSEQHIPQILGRLRGYINGLVPNHEQFLVLGGVGDSSISEVERPMGGSVELPTADGNIVIMRSCTPPPKGGKGLGFKLQLPASLRQPPIEASQRCSPLATATWAVHEQGQPVVFRTTLRVMHVPSLFLAMRRGFPFRCVINGSPDDPDFNGEATVSVLAQHVGARGSSAKFGGVTEGGIIIDAYVDGDSTEDNNAITRMFSDALAGTTPFERCEIKVVQFDVPGLQALQRLLEWRLISAAEHAALISAAKSGTDAVKFQLIDSCVALSKSWKTEWRLPEDSMASRIIDDARESEIKGFTEHDFWQLAQAHVQQICPEMNPVATSTRAHETEFLLAAAQEFQKRADRRKGPVPPVSRLMSVDVMWSGARTDEDATSWVVTLRAGFGTRAHGGPKERVLKENRVRFGGLGHGQAFRFCIESRPDRGATGGRRPSGARRSGSPRRSSRSPSPSRASVGAAGGAASAQVLEGVLIVPPTSSRIVSLISRDPGLKPFPLTEGVFIQSGGRTHNASDGLEAMVAIMEAFEKSDENGDGTLEKSEFEHLLNELGIPLERAREMIAQADADRHGAVSYEEFVAWICHPALAQVRTQVSDGDDGELRLESVNWREELLR